MNKSYDLDKFFENQKQALDNMEAPANFEKVVRAAAEKAVQPAAGKTGGFWSRRRKALAAGAIAAAALIFAVLSFLPQEGPLPQTLRGLIEIKAAAAYTSGIDPAQGFIITSEEPLSKELIQQSLVLSPSFEYSIRQADGGKEHHILPREPLDTNTVYQLTLAPEAETELTIAPEHSWVFQTMPNFTLLSSIPRDATNWVPVSTGIELVFSQQVSEQAIESLSLEPEVPGEWQHKGDVLVFVPAEPLEYAAVYTLSIAGDLENLEGNAMLEEERLIRFETAAAQPSPASSFQIWGENNAFRPSEIPYFHYYNSHNNAGDIAVSVYRYPDIQRYAQDIDLRMGEYFWCEASKEQLLSLEGLNQVMSFETNLDERDDYAAQLYLPEPLPAGYYVATLSNAASNWQILFQVTELSAYLGYGRDQAILWLNDLATGAPIAGADIQIQNGPKLQSDAQGVAVAELSPEKERGDIFLLTQEDQGLVLSANYFRGDYYEQQKQRQAYWHYLYVDRPLYRPGDTLNFFGVLDGREAGYPPIDEARVVLEGYPLVGDAALSREIEVKNGVFEGSLQLPWLEPGYYNLSLYAGETFMHSAYFEVKAYTKPAYKLDFSILQQAAMAGDEILLEMQSAFFEGTPLPNIPFTLSGKGIADTLKVTGNSQGYAAAKVKVPQVSPHSLLSHIYYSAWATLTEAGNIDAQARIPVFNHNVEIKAEARRKDNQAELEISAYAVDMSRISDWQGDLEEQALTDLAGTLHLEAIIERRDWVKIESGSYYNPYTKQVEPRYYYDLHLEEEAVIPLEISGVAANLKSLPLATENAYNIHIKAADTQGRAIQREYYIPALENQRDEYDYHSYLQIQTPDYQYQFAPGEEIALSLQWGEEALTVEEGQVLFFRSRQEILDYQVGKDTQFNYPFLEEYIPNLNVAAVYFDGRSYYVAHTTHAIDEASKKAQLEIKTDKDIYQPGAKVKLEVLLKDGQGRPLSGHVNLNLVDEALLAIEDQYVNIAGSLFGNQYSNYFIPIVSHEMPEGRGGAEQGGEGDGVREDFRDTALFVTLQTNSQGRGEVEFTLPDNITSWRLIWQAYAPDIWAASGSENIDATLPFFADWRVEESYLAGDAPIIGLRSAGRLLPEQAQVRYTLNVPALGYQQTQTGMANVWTEFPLPELPAGEYQMEISAAWGEYEDQAAVSFNVAESKISHNKQISAVLKPGFIPQGDNRGLTTLFFSDQRHNLALQGLYTLSAQENIRLEQRISAYLAEKLLAEHFGIGEAPSQEEERSWQEGLFQYQQEQGLAILPYAKADLEASVLAASFAPEILAKESLAAYFERNLNQAREADPQNYQQATLSLWGLAALSQPVLTQIEQMLALPEIRAENRLHLILGLYFAGGGAQAKNLAADLTEQWTEPINTLYRAKIGGEKEAVLKATARLALLANIYQLPQADGLYQYILENRSEEDYFLLEQLGILKARLSQPLESAAFSYTLKGEKTEVDLSKRGYFALTLQPEDLQNINFSNIEGEVVLTSFFKEPGLPQANAASSALSLKRIYPSEENLNKALKERGRFSVELEYNISADALSGYYRLTEYLPAGLSYVKLLSSPNNIWLMQEGDKELVFAVYKDKEAVSGRIAYSVRPSAAGVFQAEGAYLSHMQHFETYAQVPAESVHIQP